MKQAQTLSALFPFPRVPRPQSAVWDLWQSALYAAAHPTSRHLCRDMSNKVVAQLLHLHEHRVKDLDIRYMQAWLAKTPSPAPGLSLRRLDPPVFYPLAGGTQMAMAPALREVCSSDRAALGGHRGVLHTPQQGQAGLREGLNNKIRVLPRRTYGYRGEEYLRLKMLIDFLLGNEDNAPTRICIELNFIWRPCE